MNKLLLTMMISVMFSQGVMAMNTDSQMVEVDNLIARAKQQGYAVAQCRYGLCRDTDDGDYVSISNVSKDGYYVYDPMSADAPEDFEVTSRTN